ncbi:hypothetical protein D3C80_1553120 [compost metagenome]
MRKGAEGHRFKDRPDRCMCRRMIGLKIVVNWLVFLCIRITYRLHERSMAVRAYKVVRVEIKMRARIRIRSKRVGNCSPQCHLDPLNRIKTDQSESAIEVVQCHDVVELGIGIENVGLAVLKWTHVNQQAVVADKI